MKSLVDFINESNFSKSEIDERKKYVEKILKKYNIDLDDRHSMENVRHSDDFGDEFEAQEYIVMYNNPEALKYVKKSGSEVLLKGKDIMVVTEGPDFDYDEFWNYVRWLSAHNTVLVSELNAPDDFKVIWEQEVSRSIKATDKGKAVEKLFKYKY